MFLESCGDKSAGPSDRIASFAQHGSKTVPDMRHARPNFQLHGDVGLAGPSSQARGVVQQNLRRTHLDEQRRQPGQIGV